MFRIWRKIISILRQHPASTSRADDYLNKFKTHHRSWNFVAVSVRGHWWILASRDKVSSYSAFDPVTIGEGSSSLQKAQPRIVQYLQYYDSWRALSLVNLTRGQLDLFVQIWHDNIAKISLKRAFILSINFNCSLSRTKSPDPFLCRLKTERNFLIYTAKLGMNRLTASVVKTKVLNDGKLLNFERYLRNCKHKTNKLFSWT